MLTHAVKSGIQREKETQKGITLDWKCEYEKYKLQPKPKAERWLKLQAVQGASNIVWLQ